MTSAYANAGDTISFSSAAEEQLRAHTWPGNVRELDNVVQRAIILKTGSAIEARDLRFERVACFDHALNAAAPCADDADGILGRGLNKDLKAREQDLIISALKARSSRREVAEKLGISPRTLRYKLAKLRDAGVAIPA
jgi:two-component system response regulator FlrC